MSKDSFNPLGTEVAQTLSSVAPMVSPYELLEIVTEEVEKYLPSSLNGDKKAQIAARQRVLTFMTSLEYRSKKDLHRHIGKAAKEKLSGRWPNSTPGASAERIAKMSKDHEPFSSEDYLGDVDQPIAPGGRTALMVEAEAGDFDEVKRLHELGARTGLLDNWGYTAEVRARVCGHEEIGDWLKEHPQ